MGYPNKTIVFIIDENGQNIGAVVYDYDQEPLPLEEWNIEYVKLEDMNYEQEDHSDH